MITQMATRILLLNINIINLRKNPPIFCIFEPKSISVPESGELVYHYGSEQLSWAIVWFQHTTYVQINVVYAAVVFF